MGWIGEIHPLVAAEWELEQTVAAFELDLDAVPEPPTDSYRDVTTFPEVREDLAVVVSEDVPAARVLDTVRRGGAPLLHERGGVRRVPQPRDCSARGTCRWR